MAAGLYTDQALALTGPALTAHFFIVFGGVTVVQTLLCLTLQSSGLAYSQPLTLSVMSLSAWECKWNLFAQQN